MKKEKNKKSKWIIRKRKKRKWHENDDKEGKEREKIGTDKDDKKQENDK